MGELIFSDKLQSGYQYNFKPALFNRLDYLYKIIANPQSFFIFDQEHYTLDGQIHFSIREGVATSLPNALFGSLECCSVLPDTALKAFVQHVEDELAFSGVHKINIIQPPAIYQPQLHDLLVKLWKDQGYVAEPKYKNHHIQVDENPLADQMHEMEIRRLKKCVEADYIFEKVPAASLDQVYEVINTWRNQKSIPITISLSRLQQAFKLFPDHYQVFVVKDHKKWCAATVGVHTADDVLYNFLPASDPAYNSMSPAVMLYEGLYDYCRKNDIKNLDLGVSTLADGTHQDDLIEFKKHLGGIEQSKYRFSKSIQE